MKSKLFFEFHLPKVVNSLVILKENSKPQFNIDTKNDALENVFPVKHGCFGYYVSGGYFSSLSFSALHQRELRVCCWNCHVEQFDVSGWVLTIQDIYSSVCNVKKTWIFWDGLRSLTPQCNKKLVFLREQNPSPSPQNPQEYLSQKSLELGYFKNNFKLQPFYRNLLLVGEEGFSPPINQKNIRQRASQSGEAFYFQGLSLKIQKRMKIEWNHHLDPPERKNHWATSHQLLDRSFTLLDRYFWTKTQRPCTNSFCSKNT